MKTRILIYGDSNTWGHRGIPGRYRTTQQWPHILAALLGDEYEIIQEGLGGRTAGDLESSEVHRNGRTGFEIAMRTANPIDYTIIALGTNDTKRHYGQTAAQVIANLDWYDQRIRDFVEESPHASGYEGTFYLGLADIKLESFDEDIARAINQGLSETKPFFIPITGIEHGADGLHYSETDHQKVARTVYEALKKENI